MLTSKNSINIHFYQNLGKGSATHKSISFSDMLLTNIKAHPVINLTHEKTSGAVGHTVVYSHFPEVLFGSARPGIHPVTQFHIYIIGFHDLQYRNGDHKQSEGLYRGMRPCGWSWAGLVVLTSEIRATTMENTAPSAAAVAAAILQYLPDDLLLAFQWIMKQTETILNTEVQVYICV